MNKITILIPVYNEKESFLKLLKMVEDVDFGLEKEISSPTFTIVNEYKNEKANIYHFDVYRLSDIDEFYAIGGEEYFGKGICLIEWGEIIEEILPERYLKIIFERDLLQSEKMRKMIFEEHGDFEIEKI